MVGRDGDRVGPDETGRDGGFGLTYCFLRGRQPTELPESLAEALQRQEDEFRSQHPEIYIRPVVWDLQKLVWPAAAAGT